ncbi:hypothetical protein JCM11251_006150 [Rhodosporidiobolus azoricus]
MDESPRRNTQANRQARRQSPYARPEPQQPQQTPSRLRSLLSYVSPFRSSARKQPELEIEEVQDLEAERSVGEDEDVKQEEEDGQQSADEAAQFALHGRLLPGGQKLNRGAPVTPSPANGGSFPRSAQFRSLTPSLSLSASSSLPNLASAARSPRLSASASPNSATHELARFWQEKAQRGEEHLTAVEQAGVMQLMQQAQTEATLPTAFTPNFRTVSPPRTSLSFPFSASDALSAHSSALTTSRAGSAFGGDAPSLAGSARSTTPAGGSKRRRPLYVGAGYSSRRRTSLAAGKAALSALPKSQSESSLFSLAESSNVDGKRRRTAEDEQDEDDIPVARLDDIVTLPASPSYTARQAEKSRETAKPKLHSQPPFSRLNAGVSTPAKPSPLWQVSQADTATPSPPRKATLSTPAASSATPAVSIALTPKTAAANLMLGIIAQSDAANPAGAKKAKVVVEKGKEAFLNPYANAEGEEDLLSIAGSKQERVPRSRAKIATPGRARAAKVEAAQKAAQKEKERKEQDKKRQKEMSPLEQLERTMPAEYRPSRRSQAFSSPPAPAPAKKEEKKELEVVELLSSDVEVEEDEEMQQGENDEEDQLDQEEAEEEDDEIVVASPPPAAKKPAFSFGGASSSSIPFGSSSTSSAGFGGFGFAPAPSPSSTNSTPATKPAAPPSSAFSFSVPPAPTEDKVAKAATPPALPAPSPSFAFTVPSSTPAAASTIDTKDAKSAALALPRSSLPLTTFSFASVFSTSSRRGDAVEEAVKKLVREMGKGELPMFAF